MKNGAVDYWSDEMTKKIPITPPLHYSITPAQK
jgi:hypothetical protein